MTTPVERLKGELASATNTRAKDKSNALNMIAEERDSDAEGCDVSNEASGVSGKEQQQSRGGSRQRARTDMDTIDRTPIRDSAITRDLIEFQGLKKDLDHIRAEIQKKRNEMKLQREQHELRMLNWKQKREEELSKDEEARQQHAAEKAERQRLRQEAELKQMEEEEVREQRELVRRPGVGAWTDLAEHDKSVWMEAQYEKELEEVRAELERVRSELLREREQRQRTQEEQELWLIESDQRWSDAFNRY